MPDNFEQTNDLATIQKLQFSEKEKAERLLQHWLVEHMGLHTEQVTLTPKPVSLNSFNGIYRASGEEYFFKTHVEEQGVLEEYYNAELLYQAGYNVVRPIRTLHEKGRQMVIYPVIRWSVMFDLMRAIESGNTGEATIAMLTEAEKREAKRLLEIYRATLKQSTAQEHVQAPIHQLFWYRLAGERLSSYYVDKQGPSIGNTPITFEQIQDYTWEISGMRQERTLGELIERGKSVLDPARSGYTIIGHGDAHFGNVFLESERNYLYFDPAFAGKHSPLLDVIKPLFHNIFATWMYFPQEIAREFTLQVTLDEQRRAIVIEHDYMLTPLRQAMLQTKVEYLLKPLITWLREESLLPGDWQDLMQLAMMCCPLLTVNLFDRQRFPNNVSWLGLTLAVVMGNNGLEMCGIRTEESGSL